MATKKKKHSVKKKLSKKKVFKRKIKKTKKVKKSKSTKKIKKTKSKSPKRDKKGRFKSSKTTKKVSKRTTKRKKELLSSKPIPTKKVTKTRKFVTVLPKLIPFYDLTTASPEMFTEPIPGAVDAYMTASHANNKDPDIALPEAFEKAFIGALRKGPFEADEVMIYRYGIILRPRRGKLTSTLKEKISEYLRSIKGVSVHHVQEEGTFSLRVNLGSPLSGVLSGVVSEELNKHKSLLGDLYSTFNDYFEDGVDWFSFWDTEEAMYA